MQFCVLYLMSVLSLEIHYIQGQNGHQETGVSSTVQVRAAVEIKWESKGKVPETENQHLKADNNHAHKTFLFCACRHVFSVTKVHLIYVKHAAGL